MVARLGGQASPLPAHAASILLIALATTVSGPLMAADCTDYGASNPLVDWWHFNTHIQEIHVHEGILYSVLWFDGSTIRLHEVRSLSSPALISTLTLPGQVWHIRVYGGRLYGHNKNTLWIIDVADPAQPRILCSFRLDFIRDYVAIGNLVYTIDSDRGLHILDVSDPVHPRVLSNTRFDRKPDDVTICGLSAVVSCQTGGLRVVDVSDPAAPVVRASLTSTYDLRDLETSGHFVIASDPTAGLHVFDLSDPLRPVHAGVQSDLKGAFSLGEDHLFVCREEGVHVLDASALPAMRYLHLIPQCRDATQVVVDRGRAYAFDWPRFLWAADFRVDTRQPEPLYRGHGLGTLAHLKVAGPLIYAEYYDNGYGPQGSGLRIIDPNPAGEPIILGDYPCSYPQAIELVGDRAYLAADRDGILVLGVGDPGNIELRGQTYLGQVFGLYMQFALDLVVAGDWAYAGSGGLSYESGNLSLLSLASPDQPAVVRAIPYGRNVLELELLGDVLAALVMYRGIVTLDVTEDDATGQPRLAPLGELSLNMQWGYTDMIRVGSTLYVLESGQVIAIDCSDPRAPALLGICSLPSDFYSHGLAHHEGFLYAGTPTAGVAVLDARDPAQLQVIGYINGEAYTSGLAVGHGMVYSVRSFSHAPAILQGSPLQCGPQVQARAIDVMPGSPVNPVNCRREGGVIPVAILTTPEYDARDVDHTTVRFGPGQAPEAHQRRGVAARHEADVDGDGDLDLLFHFESDAAGIRCGDAEVILTGLTHGGEAFEGRDRIRTVPDGEGEAHPSPESPSVSELLGCYPNPFNPLTSIRYTLDEPGPVSLTVYDLRGHEVRRLRTGEFESAGGHTLVWNGEDAYGRRVPSGTYFLRLVAGRSSRIMRMTLLK